MSIIAATTLVKALDAINRRLYNIAFPDLMTKLFETEKMLATFLIEVFF
ncbi:hypothetical protein H1Q63_09005 [Desmonostoc muscorum CCALA 125]|nr:hypothetical protein [Desmonostoc muscorum CCALA 125]